LTPWVLRAGFARTIYQARQTVSHGHVTVDGRKVDKPSYLVAPGQVVEIAEIAERSKALLPFVIAAAGEHAAAIPAYRDVDTTAPRARLTRRPTSAGDPGHSRRTAHRRVLRPLAGGPLR
jgi:small subunit ribosomal protein S4